MAEPRASFSGQVAADGRILVDDRARWRKALARFRGKRITLTLGRELRPRTLQQLRYLFGVVYALLSEWSGHTPEELHEAMKRRHLTEIKPLPNGEELVTTGSTTNQSTLTMAEFIDRVLADAAGWGVEIPAPGEVSL